MIMLLEAVIKNMVDELIDAGAAEGMRQRLAPEEGERRKKAFESCLQQAVQASGAEENDFRALLAHPPFQHEVIGALLNPTSEFDPQAAMREWSGRLPLQAEALKRFFRRLNNVLLRDPYWGEILERYQQMRDDPVLERGRCLDERQLVQQVFVSGTWHHSQNVGVYNRGYINTGGGDIVVRDKIININKEDPEELLKVYYDALAKECRQLPLGVVDPRFVSLGTENQVDLTDVYTDLDVIPVAGQETIDTSRRRERETKKDGRVPLRNVLEQSQSCVLLGEVGSGKTTFVSYLTYRLADSFVNSTPMIDVPAIFRGRLPIRVVLRKTIPHIDVNEGKGDAEIIWNTLRDEFQRYLGASSAEKLASCFPAWLRGRRLVVLFDGLDEIPETKRDRLLEALQAFLKTLPDACWAMVTARPYSYAAPRWNLPGFRVWELAEFDQSQIKNFVEHWYQAVRPVFNWDEQEALRRSERLVDAVEEQSYLVGLAKRPLLLTLMATLHSSWGHLPDDRANLYEEAVKLLLSRWQSGRMPDKDDGATSMGRALGLPENCIRLALERLAYRTHERQWREHANTGIGGLADIPLNDVFRGFDDCTPDDLNPRVLVRYLQNRAGLLIEREEGIYTFPHRSFQEYLAACYLTNQVEYSKELYNLVCQDVDWWREVALLSIGKKLQGGLGEAVATMAMLIPVQFNGENLEDTSWHLAILAGQAWSELRLIERGAIGPFYENILKQIQFCLLRLIKEGHLSVKERVDAGNWLGRLGDPRFDPKCFLLPQVKVETGSVLSGFALISAVNEASTAPSKNSIEPLDDFWIGLYPVTVAQYHLFVKANAYDDPQWWEEITGGDLWRKQCKRRSPLSWEDQLSYPNKPVTGVTWHEARAYCKWIDTQLRFGQNIPQELSRLFAQNFCMGLPSKEEWQIVAGCRAQKGYPWGENFNPECANTLDAKIGAASPVGCFPKGCSPHGVFDLSGNVWEWTDTPFDRSKGEVQGAIVAEGSVICGGSFKCDSEYIKSDTRSWRYRDSADSDLGFRLVISRRSHLN